MGKVFLSHSSNDKDYVRIIADKLGTNFCIFDEACFEYGMKPIDEIVEALNQTDLFVFFISNSSLDSPWVNFELYKAYEKNLLQPSVIQQIFPVIIDETISYDDHRIADFLKTGMNSYNLRLVSNPVLAYKKIRSQIIRLQMAIDSSYEDRKTFFYGRDLELKKFKESYDDVTKEPMKCIVVSGIEGIGRQSFICKALKDVGKLKKYYFPHVITLSVHETIDDLIVKISDLGFSDYSIGDITALSAMPSKIEILTDLLKKVQEHREHIVIYDTMCLVDYDQTIKWWFEKALEKARPELAISILTNAKLSYSRYKHHKGIYFTDLFELSQSERLGLLRGYSEQESILFSRDDIEYIAGFLNGYPPQVYYCVDLAKENSVDYVKSNSYLVVERSSKFASNIINLAVDGIDKGECLGFLSFLSDYETTPITVVKDILDLHPPYKTVFTRLLALTICRYSGSSQEYVAVNSVIQDYIQRNDHELPSNIKKYLVEKTHDFIDKVKDDEYTGNMDFSEITYYVKNNLKTGNIQKIPDKFLYSTVFLKTVIELYNENKTQKVIAMVQELKETKRFNAYDTSIKNRLQYYYCLSLAKEVPSKRDLSTVFEHEIEYFDKSDDKGYVDYHFLVGFKNRLSGKYEAAENELKAVITKHPRHKQACRELVSAYRLQGQYAKAISLAKDNYYANPENVYHIQAYMECIVKQPQITPEQKQEIEQMIKIIEQQYQEKPMDIHMELKSYYQFYVANNRECAVQLLKNGLTTYPNSIYIRENLFDFYELMRNVQGMSDALTQLRKVIDNGNQRFEPLYVERDALLRAHKGVPKGVIEVDLKRHPQITVKMEHRILNRISKIT